MHGEYTSPWVLKHSTDPLDPTEIEDWPERVEAALIPYVVRNGRPCLPDFPGTETGVKVVRGRNGLPRWGENPMADALVTCTHLGVRYVLLIERGDDTDADGNPTPSWAMPGGKIEPGERPLMAAVRELREETGLDLFPFNLLWRLDEPCWVPDPRGSREAWAVTVVARADLGVVKDLPEVHGDSDARDAHWVIIDPEWGVDPGYRIFAAHRRILATL